MPNKTAAGGTHRDGCWCGKCKPEGSRSWQEEAIPERAGTGGDALEFKPETPLKRKRGGRIGVLEKQKPGYINADLPEVFHTAGKGGRERIAQWVALRATEPNITMQEAADRMGMSKSSLNSYITKATKEGWLKFDDNLARMKYEIVPKATDNLSELLDLKDKTATLETMKGTAFKAFQAAEGISDAAQTMLALKIEMIPPNQEQKVITGQIVGRPRELKE